MLTILHTNDFHNHLDAGQAGRLRELRRQVGDSGMLLDAGDAVASGNITYRPGGEPILDAMSEIGYDAMTVGNREFHFSRVGFVSKLSRARFPVLCGNVRAHHTAIHGTDPRDPSGQPLTDANSEPLPLPVVPSLCRDLCGGRRIVVFGVTVPMITERMLSRKISAYVFDDPIASAAALVPRLRERFRPHLVVALTHIGIGKDRELAAAVPGIDLIVGGHTHVALEHGERVGSTLIVQAGSHGRYYGRVEVTESDSGTHAIQASLEPL